MKEMCENCRYFRKHYVKVGKQYRLAGIGHCIKPRIKPRKNITPACQHYQPMEQEE